MFNICSRRDARQPATSLRQPGVWRIPRNLARQVNISLKHHFAAGSENTPVAASGSELCRDILSAF